MERFNFLFHHREKYHQVSEDISNLDGNCIVYYRVIIFVWFSDFN